MAQEELSRQFGEDIATIKADLKNLNANFCNFREEVRGDDRGVLQRLGSVENKVTKNTERISNMNVFQTALTLISGVIASYLGVKK